jgi:hypothetical protein
MKSGVDKISEEKKQAFARNSPKINSSVDSTFQFVDNRKGAIAQRKLQDMAYNSPQQSKLRSFQEMAINSPKAKQTAQLQTMANQQQSSKVAQLTGLRAAGNAIRLAGRFATGVGLAGSAADIYGNSRGLDISKIDQPEHFKKFSNIGRETIVAGLSLTPWTKTASVVSLANNMFDMQNKVREKDPMQTIKSLFLGEVDKFGAVGVNLGTFGSVVTALGGAEKLLSNRTALADGLTSVAEFMQRPASDSDISDFSMEAYD